MTDRFSQIVGNTRGSVEAQLRREIGELTARLDYVAHSARQAKEQARRDRKETTQLRMRLTGAHERVERLEQTIAGLRYHHKFAEPIFDSDATDSVIAFCDAVGREPGWPTRQRLLELGGERGITLRLQPLDDWDARPSGLMFVRLMHMSTVAVICIERRIPNSGVATELYWRDGAEFNDIRPGTGRSGPG